MIQKESASTFCAALVVALLAPFGLAQSRPASGGFTLEQVMSTPFPSDLAAASKANRIAWAVAFKGQRNIWIADAPNFTARQVTHYNDDDGGELASVRLTPDGRTVLYSRNSTNTHDNDVADPTSNVQEPKQDVWAADADAPTAQPRRLGEM